MIILSFVEINSVDMGPVAAPAVWFPVQQWDVSRNQDIAIYSVGGPALQPMHEWFFGINTKSASQASNKWRAVVECMLPSMDGHAWFGEARTESKARKLPKTIHPS